MNALLHAPWLTVLGWSILHTLWEGALVALTMALVLRSLRGATPRLRYAVAATGLLVMALLPLRHLVPVRQEPPPIQQVQGSLQSRPAALQVDLPPPTPALRTRVVVGLERVLPWVVLIWIVGALLSFIRLAGGWVWLQRLRWQRAELAPDALQRLLLDLCRRSGLKRAVTLLMCEGLKGPSVVGILRPAILVPTGWFLHLPPDHLEALLAHELAHVLRHDYAVNLLQSLVEVLLFYHPGVWWLSRRIRTERELACDTFAVRLMGNALPLAEALTDLERRGLGRASFEPAPAAHGGSLMERITHLLMPPRRSSSAPAFGAMTIMTLVLASGLHVWAQTPDPTPDVPPAIPEHTPEGPGLKIRTAHSNLYIRSRNAKDAAGKDLPYTQLFDIKADQMPLNQLWKDFKAVADAPQAQKTSQTWDSRDESIPGPRVNIDLEGAKPDDVVTLLHRLAALHGVAPYQAPPTAELPPFRVASHRRQDGQITLDLHARQVSRAFLDELLTAARKLSGLPSGSGIAQIFTREGDTGHGPKLDAIFEGLTLQELEAGIQRLQAPEALQAAAASFPNSVMRIQVQDLGLPPGYRVAFNVGAVILGHPKKMETPADWKERILGESIGTQDVVLHAGQTKGIFLDIPLKSLPTVDPESRTVLGLPVTYTIYDAASQVVRSSTARFHARTDNHADGHVVLGARQNGRTPEGKPNILVGTGLDGQPPGVIAHTLKLPRTNP